MLATPLRPSSWEVLGDAPSQGRGRRLIVRCPVCARTFNRPVSNVTRTRHCSDCWHEEQRRAVVDVERSLKRCTECREMKPFADFHKNGVRKTKVSTVPLMRGRCKACEGSERRDKPTVRASRVEVVRHEDGRLEMRKVGT